MAKTACKPRPKTGEKRKTRQPLKLDRMPEGFRDAVLYLRNGRYLTWLQMEERSSLPFSEDWRKDGGGFVNWDKVPIEILEQYPNLRIPYETLRRFYDLRVDQVQAQVMAESAVARKFAQTFAGSSIEDANDAVINAMRDQVFALAGRLDEAGREQYMGALSELTLAMSRIQRVDLMKRKVTVEEKKVDQMVKDAEFKQRKIEEETSGAARKLGGGATLTLDDINALRRNSFGLPPLGPDGKVAA